MSSSSVTASRARRRSSRISSTSPIARGLPLVATNEVFFPARDDYEAHDALICISEGAVIADDNRRRLTPEHYFKSREEMTALFADLPEATRNTVEIAMRCRVLAAGAEADPAALRRRRGRCRDAPSGPRRNCSGSRRGTGSTGGSPPTALRPDGAARTTTTRLEFELGVIDRMKYPGYFLIVADFIQWAKAQGIPVGPGRGSGAGSVVAWSLTITDLDPLRFDLLFERFLNPDRVSMPDFDIDFCQNRRDEVIHYVQGKYGADRVAQIITFGTLQARAVLRDVGRVLQMPYGQVDRIAKMIPFNPAAPVTLEKAIDDEPRLQAMRDEEPVVARLLAIAPEAGGTLPSRLDPCRRHRHRRPAARPAGAALPRPALRHEGHAVQHEVGRAGRAGEVRLPRPQDADRARHRGPAGSPAGDRASTCSRIPLDDGKSYDMLARGETVGVFQVESAGMRRALVDMRPDRFEDMIALVALFRPGPMANIPTYCARKLGHEEVEYLPSGARADPRGDLRDHHLPGAGAADRAGTSPAIRSAEADLLRRAMGKKIKAEMDAQRGRFLEGATERGIDRDTATTIFDACAKFADTASTSRTRRPMPSSPTRPPR